MTRQIPQPKIIDKIAHAAMWTDGEVLCGECGLETRPVEACEECGDSPFLRDYALTSRIGHGAIGTTYEAIRLSDGKLVAVKEILVRRFESVKGMEMFDREADVLQKLDHPGIPKYYDHFTHGDGKSLGFYLVQEFIDGETLEEESAGHSYSVSDVLEIGRELAEILEAIEDRVVHRDIKPANVMRRAKDDQLMLIDFGSVRQVAHSITDGSTITGTVGYMAPEQLMGRASFATDVYGVGMTLLRLKLGSLPVEIRGEDGKLAKSLKLGRLRDILDPLVDVDPAKRPANAKALRKALAGTPKRSKQDKKQPEKDTWLAKLDKKRSTNLSPYRARSSGPFAAVGRFIAWIIVIGIVVVGIGSTLLAGGSAGLGVLGLTVVLGVLGGVIWSHPAD